MCTRAAPGIRRLWQSALESRPVNASRAALISRVFHRLFSLSLFLSLHLSPGRGAPPAEFPGAVKFRVGEGAVERGS